MIPSEGEVLGPIDLPGTFACYGVLNIGDGDGDNDTIVWATVEADVDGNPTMTEYYEAVIEDDEGS
jgi:hypothetical protein